MTRKESRRVKLQKQFATMRERGYKLVCGQWVREDSAYHKKLIAEWKSRQKK